MANEFIHIDPGAILTKAEYELITGHQFNSQATGDILYASTSTQLSRLGIGSNTNVLEITGGVPAWVATSGTGSVARVSSPTFVTPALGTPSALVATNASGTASSLTAGTVTTNANLTGHVTSSGNAAVLGSFTSAQLAGALTNETGSGLAVFGTSPTLVTPALGTPSALVATNASGTASSLTAGNVTTNANLTGHVTSTGNAAVLGSFTSAQLATALTNETGSGAAVFGTSPTLVTPALGTPASGVMTNVSGTAASLTAGAATALATARTIGGTSFDGTGNIAVALSTEATNITATANNSTDETVYPVFVDGATGTQGAETDTGLTYNPSTGLLTSAGFSGPLTGNVTGNASGTSGSTTGNAATVTTNANLTGVVTSSGNATAIADKALAIAKLADGTDGELITWNASGVIAAVAAGTDTHVLTSNGAGAAPTFQAAGGGGPSQATQSALEAETNEDTYAPPDLIKYSPGVAKAWLFTTYDGGTPQITLGHRISSLGDEGTGHIQVNFSTNFSSAAYAAVVTTDGNDSIERCAYTETTHAVGAIDYFQVNITDDSNVDGASSIICFGDYA